MKAIATLLAALLFIAVPAHAEPLAELEATSVAAPGTSELSGALAGFLQKGIGIEPTAFMLEAGRLDVEEDRTRVVAATSGVVVQDPNTNRTDRHAHIDATVSGEASDDQFIFAVFPEGPVVARGNATATVLHPGSGTLSAPSRADTNRVEPSRDVRGAAAVSAPGSNITLEGDLLLVFWSWEIHVTDRDRETTYVTGRIRDDSLLQEHIERGELVQLYVHAKDAVLRMTLPTDAGLHLRSTHLSGVERVELTGALGSVAGKAVRGRDVSLSGEDLRVQTGASGASYLGVRVEGRSARAVIEDQAMPLGFIPHDRQVLGIWAAVATAAVVGTACAVAYRAGRRGPYHSRCLNLSDRAFERGWGRWAHWFASAHVRHHPRCGDGWKLKTDALHMLGRQGAEAACREHAHPLFLNEHRLHNAMRLVVLKGALGDVDGALEWLDACRGMDQHSIQRLASSPMAESLSRDDRFRAAAARFMGLEHHATV